MAAFDDAVGNTGDASTGIDGATTLIAHVPFSGRHQRVRSTGNVDDG